MSDPKAAAEKRSRRQPEDRSPVLRHASEQETTETADSARYEVKFTADADVVHADGTKN